MELAPEILKMRDALLERVNGKSLKEVAEIVNEILLSETNHVNRLAALSARVQVLREHTKSEFNINKKHKINLGNKELDSKKPKLTDSKLNNKIDIKDKESWVRVEMLKSGIVNGVRFPEGVVIDVNKKDADNLENQKLVKVLDAESSEEVKETEVSQNTEETTKIAEASEEVKETEVSQNTEETTKIAEASEEVNSKNKIDQNEANNLDNSGIGVEQKIKREDLETNNIISDEEKNTNIASTSKKILKKKSTKITEETIELTDPKAVAEALGLNEKKKKEDEPVEIEEEVDLESLELEKTKK